MNQFLIRASVVALFTTLTLAPAAAASNHASSKHRVHKHIAVKAHQVARNKSPMPGRHHLVSSPVCMVPVIHWT